MTATDVFLSFDNSDLFFSVILLLVVAALFVASGVGVIGYAIRYIRQEPPGEPFVRVAMKVAPVALPILLVVAVLAVQ